MQAESKAGMADEVLLRPERAINMAAIVFVALQGMDLLTTLAAFSHGAIELNPLVRSLMPWTGKVAAVLASKAILISLVLMLSRRKRILRFANILYAGVAVWNIVIVFTLT